MENNLNFEKEKKISLAKFFNVNHGGTQFSNAFLSEHSLAKILQMLQENMFKITQDARYRVEFTEQIIGYLIYYMKSFKVAHLSQYTLERVQRAFVSDMSHILETEYLESKTWGRYCEQGIPDPNNIPLPETDGNSENVVLTDGYILTHPHGGPPKMW